jgi:hypothetical protein
MAQEPQDAIDPNLTDALSALIAAYSGDFDLGGPVRDVDLLGAISPGLSARAGYINQDSKRVPGLHDHAAAGRQRRVGPDPMTREKGSNHG